MSLDGLFDAADVRLLIDDRVGIVFHGADLTVARVVGAFAYEVRWRPAEGWSCTCLLGPICAHVRAVQRVTVRPEQASA